MLDFAEITCRRFNRRDMGSLAPVAASRQIFKKHSHAASFDPYSKRGATLQASFTKLLSNGE